MSDRLAPVAYELSLSEAVDGPWQVTRVWVGEALNRPYRAVVDASTEAENPDTDALLGCDATLRFMRGEDETRVVCGVVSQVDFLGYRDHHLMVRLHFAPAYALLGQRVTSRIWQSLSVQDIVGEVLDALGDYGRSLDTGSISAGTSAREYCVQYRESDFDFVSRLLEEEGVSYEFVHDGDAGLESLTLRDANDQYTELTTLDGSSEVPIIASNPGLADVESVQVFEWSKKLTSTGTLRRDYDWNTPRDLLTEAAEGADERGRERRRYAPRDPSLPRRRPQPAGSGPRPCPRPRRPGRPRPGQRHRHAAGPALQDPGPRAPRSRPRVPDHRGRAHGRRVLPRPQRSRHERLQQPLRVHPDRRRGSAPAEDPQAARVRGSDRDRRRPRGRRKSTPTSTAGSRFSSTGKKTPATTPTPRAGSAAHRVGRA